MFLEKGLPRPENPVFRMFAIVLLAGICLLAIFFSPPLRDDVQLGIGFCPGRDLYLLFQTEIIPACGPWRALQAHHALIHSLWPGCPIPVAVQWRRRFPKRHEVDAFGSVDGILGQQQVGFLTYFFMPSIRVAGVQR